MGLIFRGAARHGAARLVGARLGAAWRGEAGQGTARQVHHERLGRLTGATKMKGML